MGIKKWFKKEFVKLGPSPEYIEMLELDEDSDYGGEKEKKKKKGKGKDVVKLNHGGPVSRHRKGTDGVAVRGLTKGRIR